MKVDNKELSYKANNYNEFHWSIIGSYRHIITVKCCTLPKENCICQKRRPMAAVQAMHLRLIDKTQCAICCCGTCVHSCTKA